MDFIEFLPVVQTRCFWFSGGVSIAARPECQADSRIL